MHLRDFAAPDAVATLTVFRRAVHGAASRDYTPEQLAAWTPAEVDETAWGAGPAASRTRVACDAETVNYLMRCPLG
ncbi:hypothetical protein [Cellulosimicrobium arenosum]|uniref:Acetyltransferase n=1 Tax=Cellulosimicrobium arenosum TaxID=2708133 RepID=A0A927IYS7_9MICO|nr:hypothetical protein [Cellulosimicrobium arenosum]MBD8077617.1 hypothetical protein [Cellulosimicrobium arenosum]